MEEKSDMLRRLILATSFILLAGCAAVLGPSLKPGIEALANDDAKTALDYFEAQIKAGKTSPALYRWGYEAAFRSGNLGRAKDFYNDALAAGFPEDSLNQVAKKVWYLRAKELMARDDWKAAINATDVLEQLDAGSREAAFARLMIEGYFKYEKGNHKGLWDALDDFTRAHKHDPDSALPYLMMGRTRIKNDRTNYDAALEEYALALELEPEGRLAEIIKSEADQIRVTKRKMEAFWGK